MDTPLTHHEPWLNRLIAEADPDKIQRIVLEAVIALTGTAGVAQWAERPGEGFCIERELGETHESLDPSVVSAVAHGTWDPQQARHHIVIVGERPHRLAWSIGLPVASEDALMHTEAFLFLVCTLHPEVLEDEGPPPLLRQEDPLL